MRLQRRHVLICDCERTMAPNGKALASALATEEPVVQTQLCRGQIDAFKAALATGEPVLVGCTQEAPLFSEIAEEAAQGAAVSYVNIRERAGWSDQGVGATAKIAALLAEAALDIEATPAVTLRADGAVLVYGEGETALAAARQLVRRLNVTLLLKDARELQPPSVMNVPVFCGHIRQATGHLGAFQVTIDGYGVSVPSSRGAFRFEGATEGAVFACALILDLSGDAPLFPAPERRDGYVRVEPGDAVRLQRALFDLADLIGVFEKPRFLKIDPAICAHARNGIVGCDLCLQVCPTGAITPAGDYTQVDPYICDGHGACASVCPTGAIVFDLPRGDALFERLRVLAKTYREAGGTEMVLLVHDPHYGEDMISLLARTGRGLPAHVVPFAVNKVTQIGLDLLLTAITYGAAQVRLLAGPEHRDDLDALRQHQEIADALLAGLGYAGERIVIDANPEPTWFEESLYATHPPPALAAPAGYRAVGGKQSTLALALDHLHAQAPAPVEVVALPVGAPFGQVLLDRKRCTLCLACVGACPTRALGHNAERPQLGFTESACVQCGLCRNTCPEHAITLAPRLNFAETARRKVVLKEEEPFCCIRCGKAFATPSVISRLVERMAGHGMFALPGRLDIIKMCEDCRVIVQFEDKDAPLRLGRPPVPRVTEDYLRERAAEQAAKAQKADEA